MRQSRLLSSSSLLSCLLLFVATSAHAQYKPNLSRLVIVGDSLSAGVQNFSLLDVQQPNGYASVLANQAGVKLTLPLVPFPGAPKVLQLTSLNPLTIAPIAGTLPEVPRDNPCTQPTNLAVPGVTVDQALTLTPGPISPTDPVQGWANIVLGFPNPFGYEAGCPGTAGAPQTMVQQAVALHPTAIIEWLGNNDALVPALVGQLSELTPVPSFALYYDQVLDQLSTTKAPIITALVPDVTKVPYFTPLSTIAAETHIPVAIVAAKLGLNPGDLLRPTAAPLVAAILSGQMSGPLPSACPAPPLELPTPTVPCVLTVAQQLQVKATIDLYNIIIYAESIAHGAIVVDSHTLVDQLASTGYWADGKTLTTGFLGGLFSLDGIHPTNTGYGIIANAFISVMNQQWGTHIQPANINQIAASDPLVPPIKVPTMP